MKTRIALVVLLIAAVTAGCKKKEAPVIDDTSTTGTMQTDTLPTTADTADTSMTATMPTDSSVTMAPSTDTSVTNTQTFPQETKKPKRKPKKS